MFGMLSVFLFMFKHIKGVQDGKSTTGSGAVF